MEIWGHASPCTTSSNEPCPPWTALPPRLPSSARLGPLPCQQRSLAANSTSLPYCHPATPTLAPGARLRALTLVFSVWHPFSHLKHKMEGVTLCLLTTPSLTRSFPTATPSLASTASWRVFSSTAPSLTSITSQRGVRGLSR
jgi:hypothetical protein